MNRSLPQFHPIDAPGPLGMAPVPERGRQALDDTSTGRAVDICVVGWALSLVVAAVLAVVYLPTVS